MTTSLLSIALISAGVASGGKGKAEGGGGGDGGWGGGSVRPRSGSDGRMTVTDAMSVADAMST